MSKTAHLRLLAALVLAAALRAEGQIRVDGSLSGTVAKSLSGPNFIIPQKSGADQLAVKVGGNLFHSFSEFNLATGESATFTELDGVQNVIARVTGGTFSSIDGKISAAANLFLMNPAGIFFKEHSTLDVAGSFTATTASSLKLGNDGRFFASVGEASTLTSSPVSAFGFVGDPNGIAVSGASLAMPQGKKLSLVGGDLAVVNSTIAATGGIELASRNAAGDLPVALPFLSKGGGEIGVALSLVNAGGTHGGPVVIRGGRLALDRATIRSDTTEPGRGEKIDIRVSGSLQVANSSKIVTTTNGAGIAGEVSVSAGSVDLYGSSLIGSQAGPDTTRTAAAGTVRLSAKSLTINEESAISASTFGLGKGSLIDVAADRIKIIGGAAPDSDSGIYSNTKPTGEGGPGGEVRVRAGSLSITHGGGITADTNGRGDGGDVFIVARDIAIAARDSQIKTGIFADSNSTGNGARGGDIRIHADRLTITDGGLISTKTLGLGRGGDTNITADTIVISRNGSRFFTGIAADSPLGGERGSGGDVNISAKSVQLYEGGQISSNTFGLGPGGNVSVKADDILLVGPRESRFLTTIAADTLAEGPGGPGGSVEVIADRLRIYDGARISASTNGGGTGGDVKVLASTIDIAGTGDFTGIASSSLAKSALGPGGLIHVEADSLTISGVGSISANTSGAGPGGNASVDALSIRLINGGQISADTSGSGRGGSVTVNASRLFISGMLDQRPAGIFSGSKSEGDAGEGGRISVEGGVIDLTDAAAISASSDGAGNGGSVEIAAERMKISKTASVASSARGSGMAGDVSIHVAEPLEMTTGAAVRTTSEVSSSGTVSIVSDSSIEMDSSSITVRAALGDAGTISLVAPGTISLRASQVSAEAGLNGGNVSIDPQYVVLDHSVVSANAILGAGGNILIVADTFLASSSAVTASSQASVQGTVAIQSPDANLASGLVPLTSSVIDASTQLREQCARRLGLDFSSFLVLGRGGTPPAPDEAQSSTTSPMPPTVR